MADNSTITAAPSGVKYEAPLSAKDINAAVGSYLEGAYTARPTIANLLRKVKAGWKVEAQDESALSR